MLHHQSIDHNTVYTVSCECLNIYCQVVQSVSQSVSLSSLYVLVYIIIIAVPAIENLPCYATASIISFIVVALTHGARECLNINKEKAMIISRKKNPPHFC